MHYQRTVILPNKSSVLLKASRKQSQLIFSSKSITEITYQHWKYTSDICPLPHPMNKNNVQQITLKYWDWSLYSLKATLYLLLTHAHTVGGHVPFKLPRPFTGQMVQSRKYQFQGVWLEEIKYFLFQINYFVPLETGFCKLFLQMWIQVEYSLLKCLGPNCVGFQIFFFFQILAYLKKNFI